MFKDFTVIQCHTPHGISSMHFGGIIYRFEGAYPNGTYDEINHHLLFISASDKIYTVPFTFPEAMAQAKQYGMKLIVNMNEVIREDISLVSPELFGKVAGIIADILVRNGFTDSNAMIALINEPKERWHLTESKYLNYVNSADKYVKNRFKLIIINEEYHKFNEALIIPKLKNKTHFVWGVHHLGSLGYPSKWGNITDAKTQANEWGIPIICNEGGSWFKGYQSDEGHQINIKLIKLCKEKDYLGCSICLPELNEEGNKVYPKLGYRIWNNDYTILKSTTNWDKFEEELKKYRKEGETMPEEERDLKVIAGYMHGEDVTDVQEKLREIGFDLKVDGWYGKITEVAVKKFQELINLSPNGIADKNTRDMLVAITVESFCPEVFKNIYERKNYSAEVIDYYLDEFGHPDLKGHGKFFVQAEQESGIPVEWQLANGCQESSYKEGGIGSSPIAQKYNNLYGWAYGDSGPMPGYKFCSFKDCILHVSKRIKELFLDPDNWRYKGDHIFGIEVYYSTCCFNAINKAKYYQEICKFLDAGVRYKVPEYLDVLLSKLDERYVLKGDN